MLSDFERKLLRILFNFVSQRRRIPTMIELERVTRKPAAGITQGLDGPHLETIVILEGWERDKGATRNLTPGQAYQPTTGLNIKRGAMR